MKLVILLGAPGAGKGTQARRIAEMTGLKHMSTGQMLREEVDAGTPIGRSIAETLEHGTLVPDEVIISLIRGCIREGKCTKCNTPEECRAGFVLDGFPRNISQAKALDLMIAEQGHTLDHVVSLDVDESILKERIEYRIKESGANRRSDDTEHTLYRRLSIYREQTRPLEHYYEQQGLLRRVDGMKPIDTITGELYEIVTGRKAA